MAGDGAIDQEDAVLLIEILWHDGVHRFDMLGLRSGLIG